MLKRPSIVKLLGLSIKEGNFWNKYGNQFLESLLFVLFTFITYISVWCFIHKVYVSCVSHFQSKTLRIVDLPGHERVRLQILDTYKNLAR